MGEAPLLFSSHCHADKPAARRLARRLRAHGLDVWLDEDQLGKGARLQESIAGHMSRADAVVVVASAAAARSAWVRQEVALATAARPPKTVLPFLLDAAAKRAKAFKDHLGVDATDKHAFEDAVGQVVAACGSAFPRPCEDRERRLMDDLARTATEWPPLQLLLDDLAQHGGLAPHHADPVLAVDHHALGLALTTAYALPLQHGGSEAVAHTAAFVFARSGAGFDVLRQHVQGGPDAASAMTMAVGEPLRPKNYDATIRLLEWGHPGTDQALAGFVQTHAHALSPFQVRRLLAMATRPREAPPSEGFWLDIVMEMLRRLDGVDDLALQCCEWIRRGEFDGESMGSRVARDLARMLCDSPLRDPDHFQALQAEWVGRVRRLARTPGRKHVQRAVDATFAAQVAQAPWVLAMVRECRTATGSGEWDGWDLRDEMAQWVYSLMDALVQGRNWTDGDREFRAAWAAQQEFLQLLKDQPDGPDETTGLGQ